MTTSLARVLVALFLALPAGRSAAQATPVGAEPSMARVEAGGSDRRQDEEAATVTPLNLNTATEAELLELPGVGPSRARAILAFREQHGGFQSVSQLLRIKGFGRAMFKRLRPLLVVSPP